MSHASDKPDNTPDSGTPERDLIELAMGQINAPADPTPTRHGPIPNDLPPPGTFPGYDITREIHRGGQGVVYQAIQKATKRKVAVKVMHAGPHMGSAGRARFEREVHVLGQLDHPNIVKVHDSGVTGDAAGGGSFYYVMDYVSGRSLDEILPELSKKPIPETLALFAKICEAVNAAHLRGVIHRDLKPANIRVDSRGEPVVVDFGLAKVALPDTASDDSHPIMSMTGQFIGSLPWASPEQAQGAPGSIDVRTDVYSLGVVLYQMLTGRFPYSVRGAMRDVLDNIVKAEPARPSTVRRRINNEVETIVLKCLSKERDRRYQTAGELARDVRRYLRGEPIEAKRDSGWYVITKTVNRYRGRVAMAALFLVMIIAFAIGMTFLYRNASAARDLARHNRDLLLDGVWGMAFGVSDEIENILGSTEARTIVLDLLQESLPELEASQSDDPAFRARVAQLHDRHGELLARMYQANLGQSSDARQAHLQARRIRDPLLTENPNDPDLHAAAAENHVAMARLAQQLDRDFDAAQREAQLALDEINLAISLARADAPRKAELEAKRTDIALQLAFYEARKIGTVRNAAPIIAIYAPARKAWSDHLAADPTHAQARRQCAVIDSQIAQRLIGAADVLRASVEESPRAERLAALGDADSMLAQAHRLCLGSLGALEALARSASARADVARDINIVRHNLAQGSYVAANVARDRDASDPRAADLFQAALERIDAAVVSASQLAATDRKNAEARRDLAIYLSKRGNIRRELAEVLNDHDLMTQAEADFVESERVRSELLAADKTKLRVRELAVAHYKLGEIAQLRAGAAPAGEPRASLYASALQWYDMAHRGFASLASDGVAGMDTLAAQVQRTREACLAESENP